MPEPSRLTRRALALAGALALFACGPAPTGEPRASLRPVATGSARPVPSKPPASAAPSPEASPLPPVLALPMGLNGYENAVALVATGAGAPGPVTLTLDDGPTALPPSPRALRRTPAAPDAHLRLRRLMAAAPPPRPYGLAAASPAPVKAGDVQPFWVISRFDDKGTEDVEVQARCVAVGQRCYLFVDTAVDVKQAPYPERLAEIVEAFDATIHPTNTRLFGAAPDPGVDRDPKVYILLSPSVGAKGQESTLGYFAQRDEYPADPAGSGAFKRSNAKELLTLNSRIVATGTKEDYLGTLAHEFQHMINFNQKVILGRASKAEETWVDEGMAMYAIEANGYGLKTGGPVLAAHVKRFQADAGSYSLTDWAKNPDGSAYGAVYLMMVYLADRFGEGFISDVVGTKKTGIPNLDALLAPKGLRFDQVFRDWALANWVSARLDPAPDAYGYKSLFISGANGPTALSGFKARSLAVGKELSAPLLPYSVQYVALPDNALTPRLRLGPTGGVLPRLVLP